MKKLLFFVAALMLTSTMLTAQNTFKGIVKYKVESTGEVAFQVPAEAAVAEIKVSGEDLYTKSAIFMNSHFSQEILVQGLTQTQCMDMSQLLSYLRGNGSEFTYQGYGKLVIKGTQERASLDSLTIVDTEPGHYYYEYVDGESKEIAGIQAKKVVMHSYDAEGVDHPTEMWYTDEIGPEFNVLFSGVKGMPMQCTVSVGEGRAITYTAIEVVKGKVKDADFLLPDGYETLPEDELNTLMQELQEEIELLQAE